MDKYQILKVKYESLKFDYNDFKTNNQSLNKIEELKRVLREKNKKYLMKSQKLKRRGNNQNFLIEII